MTADDAANAVWGHLLGTVSAAERLVQLAGTTGTAAALLLMIGSGGTAGAALVDYSGLPSGTAAEHLLAERVQPQPEPGFSGGMPWRPYKPRRPIEEDEALLFAVILH